MVSRVSGTALLRYVFKSLIICEHDIIQQSLAATNAPQTRPCSNRKFTIIQPDGTHFEVGDTAKFCVKLVTFAITLPDDVGGQKLQRKPCSQPNTGFVHWVV